MSRRRVALGVGANVVDRVISALILLALVPVLASHWGLARYGGWAMLSTVPGLFVLGDLGFANAATVRMVMQVARGERAAARETMHSATQVVVGACAVLVSLVVALGLLLPARWLVTMPQTSVADLRLAIISLAVYSAFAIASGLLQALFRCNGRYAAGVICNTATVVVENTALVGVVISGGGIAAAALAMLAGRTGGVALTWLIAASMRTGLLPGFSHGTADVRHALLGPALAAMAIPLATALLLQGTVFVLGLVAGAAAIPAFVAARTLSRVGLQGTQMLTHALMPEFGVATAHGNQSGAVRMVVMVLTTALIITLPFALVLAFAGPWIILLWSNDQIAVPAAMTAAIAFSAFGGGVWNPLSNLMLAMNRQADFAIAYFILAVIGVALTALLGQALGGVAAALVLAAVDLIMLGIVLRFALRHWGTPSQWLSAARRMAAEGRGLAARVLRR